ncbi:MucR family transcriptional regulator [Methylobacterium nigriterrae]|uniref:MucR family transcriptional regulator n=1 Tax=Methylobacterium nigriterrae TaxID=3127512 RepID=UPI0030137A9B
MPESAKNTQSDYIELTADIVTAYVSNNSLPPSELPDLLARVYVALTVAADGSVQAGSDVEKPTPARIKKSVAADYLISFEDGKPYKTLRRHLTLRGLTAEAYRAKYGLPVGYPMTAPSYSAQRSRLAHELGLGQLRRGKSPSAMANVTGTAEIVSLEPKARNNRRKAAETSQATQASGKSHGRRKAPTAD